MISVSLPIFVDYSIGEIQPNITFTAHEWMAITQQFNTALSDAMTIGLILGGLVVGISMILGTWWRTTGSIWWENRGNS